jgi:hypothetical protein
MEKRWTSQQQLNIQMKQQSKFTLSILYTICKNYLVIPEENVKSKAIQHARRSIEDIWSWF